jgi:hypothetical protein
VSEHALRERAAADVAEADEKDAGQRVGQGLGAGG